VRRIRWTAHAADDLEGANNYIRQDNPNAALALARRIMSHVEDSRCIPKQDAGAEVKETRELVIAPYVVVYRYSGETIEIIHIWHGAQHWR
jgi:addiction module RelE/StbE family toxin